MHVQCKVMYIASYRLLATICCYLFTVKQFHCSMYLPSFLKKLLQLTTFKSFYSVHMHMSSWHQIEMQTMLVTREVMWQ